VRPNGSDLRNISNDAASNTEPVWSRSSKYLAFVSERGRTKRIFTVNADGGGLAQVTADDGGGNDAPAWRPLLAGGG